MIGKSSRPVSDPGRILVIQLGDIGDVVLTTPALKVLSRLFPGSEITVALRDKTAELLEGQSCVSRVIPVRKTSEPWYRKVLGNASFFLNLRRSRFDTAVDLRTGSRGTILAVLSGAERRIGRYTTPGCFWRRFFFTDLVRPEPAVELLDYAPRHHLNIIQPLLDGPVEAPTPELAVSPASVEKAREILAASGVPEGRPVVAVHPFSLWRYKEWGDDKWKAVIEHLKGRHRVSIAVTGAPEDRDRASEMVGRFREGVYNLAGKTPLGLFPALLEACRLVVGVDTAALHIGAAVGTPTVGIFGPSRTAVWAPRGAIHKVAAKSLPCVPCARKGCEDSGESMCLEELEANEVTDLIDGTLGI